MLTRQNYVIFTICQYNILCHFNISFFAVYGMEAWVTWNGSLGHYLPDSIMTKYNNKEVVSFIDHDLTFTLAEITDSYILQKWLGHLSLQLRRSFRKEWTIDPDSDFCKLTRGMHILMHDGILVFFILDMPTTDLLSLCSSHMHMAYPYIMWKHHRTNLRYLSYQM